MAPCPTCGAARTLAGILYPARALCPCESRRCARCVQPAVVLEYQQIASDFESPLPDASNRQVKFFCYVHNSTAAKVAVRPEAPALPKPAKPAKPLETIKQVEAVAKVVVARRGKSSKPHISPEWCLEASPPDCNSATPVECAGCRQTHPMKARRNFNGSKSECPSCGFHVFTHANEDTHAYR
jgi:hypothetical protein